MNRTVEIILDENFTNMAGKALSGQVFHAIGYLSMWAIGGKNYTKVRIVGDRHGDIDAVYMNDAGDRTYTIGAVLRDNGEYTFHS